MFKEYLLRLKTNYLRAFREQKGQSIVIIAFAFLGLLAMLGLALDLGLVFVERIRVGRTTDAATLAAVVELPYEQDAMERAIEYIELNGYHVGTDTEILVRGCVADDLDGGGPLNAGNVYEGGNVPLSQTFPTTNQLAGAMYIPATNPRATFVIDTGSYQPGEGGCDPGSELYGSSTKIQVKGKVDVRMNFMQFFGFKFVPVQDEAIAENVTNLDVMVVMDVSASMELDTACYDCWRAFDHPAPDEMTYPNNGRFNPMPFDPNRSDVPRDPSTGEPIAQSIPESFLCTQSPTAYIPATNNPNNYQYLVHEAELYSANTSDWSVPARAPGRGVWVLQRATRLDTGSAQEQTQGNQAGFPDKQSSNICNPGIQGLGIDCTLGGNDPDTICEGIPSLSVDCSAYVKAQTFTTYQGDDDPFLNGASFDTNCFAGSTYNSTCWNDPAAPSGPGNIPALEYDFSPTWSGQTYIWVRAQGGGLQAQAWRGWLPTESMTQLNNNYGYYDAIFWQVGNSNIQRNMDTGLIINGKAANLGLSSQGGTGEWRDSRARYDRWRWVKLGFANTTPGQQYTLRLYQGSTGYKIDKIIFTNNPDGTSGHPPDHIDINDGKGPRATNGSATREACNVCNPAYGYTVDDTQCTCKQRPWDSSSPSATNCTALPVGTTGFSSLNDDMYGGLQPIRSSQEAIKRFASQLDPRFDQLGFVAFSNNVVKPGDMPDRQGARSKLQCLNWAAKELGDAGKCYDVDSFTSVLSYTNVVESIEAQRPLNGTNIADGLREGLQELGVDAYGSGFRDSSCQGDPDNDNGRACDRHGAARKVLILLTDGVPNHSPDCTGASDYGDFWDHPNTNGDRDYECAMYYAWVAANNNVTVYTIGLGAGVDPDFLNAIATGIDPRGDDPDVTMFRNARGGRYYSAPTPELLDGIFQQILDNIYVRIVG